jgi:ABC-type amino acid transport substrate-binding protein
VTRGIPPSPNCPEGTRSPAAAGEGNSLHTRCRSPIAIGRAIAASHPSPAHGGGDGGGGRPRPLEAIIAALVAIILIAPFVGFLHDVRDDGRAHDRTWERVAKTKTLRVGMDAGVPPFAMPGNGEIEGFDADLARDLAGRLGVNVAIVNTPSDALYDALLTGAVDALIAALPVTPEFRRDVAYSAPYVEMGERAIVRAGSEIRAPADLANRRVGAELGSDGDLAARALARRLPIQLQSAYDSGDAALADLRGGALDAVVLDGIAARHAVATDPTLVMLAEPALSNGYVIATKQDARILTTNLSRALDAARAAGVLTRLDARWLSGEWAVGSGQ